MSKVFISHKDIDRDIAISIAKFLEKRQITYYLDALDPRIEFDGEEITKYLQRCLSKCTHLLAVLSNATRFSWWVPFEIGLATEKQYPIASFLVANIKLPEYLASWPRLKGDYDLEKYCQLLRETPRMLIETFEKSYAYQPKNYPEAFHKILKKAIGQM